jgi:hypothetical protein
MREMTENYPIYILKEKLEYRKIEYEDWMRNNNKMPAQICKEQITQLEQAIDLIQGEVICETAFPKAINWDNVFKK